MSQTHQVAQNTAKTLPIERRNTESMRNAD